MHYAQFDFHDGAAMLIESNSDELEQLGLFLADDAQVDPIDFIKWLGSSETQKGGNTGFIKKIAGGLVEIHLDPFVYALYEEPVTLTEAQFHNLITCWSDLLKNPPREAKLVKKAENYSFLTN